MRIWRWGFVVATAASCYATLIEPNWIQVSPIKVGEEVGAESIKIAHLSDLHLSSFGYRERYVLEISKELQPDVVVLSGDIVEAPQKLSVLDQFLSSLSGRIKVAVLGNWEHWGDVDLNALRSLYEARGVDLLVNEVKEYRLRSGKTLTVAGLDDSTGGRPNVEVLKRLEGKDGMRLVIQHSPGWFDRAEVGNRSRKFDLCLSGHTHGGQVTLFGLPVWTPRGSGSYVAGLYQTSVCPLYVSRGVGTSILPIRFFSRPEMPILHLGR